MEAIEKKRRPRLRARVRWRYDLAVHLFKGKGVGLNGSQVKGVRIEKGKR